MDKTRQPGISFNGVILTSETFWRAVILPDNINNNVNFAVNFGKTDNSSAFTVEIITTLSGQNDGEELFNFKFSFVGIFSIIEGQENLNIDEFAKYNAPALIFPYIREHISSITQKAGMKPVLLPPVNIIALTDQQPQN